MSQAEVMLNLKLLDMEHVFRLMAISNWSQLQSTRARGSNWKKVMVERLINFLDKDGRTKETVVYKTDHPMQKQTANRMNKVCLVDGHRQ